MARDVPAQEPLIVARGLRLPRGAGAVFDVTAEIPRGAVVAVVGRAGAGKSSLLLGLCGRLRGVVGDLVVDGQDAARHGRRIRHSTSVARIGDLIEPERSLSLDDCITERTLADAAPARSRLANYLHTAVLLGLDAPLATHYGDLSPADRVRACVALATILPASLIVVDDIDRSTTIAEQRELWDGLLMLAGEGITVVASTSERSALPPAVRTIEMDPAHAG